MKNINILIALIFSVFAFNINAQDIQTIVLKNGKMVCPNNGTVQILNLIMKTLLIINW